MPKTLLRCGFWPEMVSFSWALKAQLSAFSDGVIAILITIMVLELKVPHGADLHALAPLWPVFVSYVLSFIYIGIYWNKLQYVSYPIYT